MIILAKWEVSVNISELKAKLSEINHMGYIVSLRKGPTGIGYTLETLLGVKENNLKSPDLGNIELKCKRIKSTSRMTMLTFNKSVWKIEQDELIKQYGYVNTKGQWALYTTAKNKPNNRGFYVRVEQDAVKLYHKDGLCPIEWQLEDLIKELKKKLANVLLVHADSRKSKGQEEFWYKEAYLLTGLIVENFLELIKDGAIVIDLRMYIKGTGSVRNHGTAFRCYRRYWDLCYSNTKRLL